MEISNKIVELNSLGFQESEMVAVRIRGLPFQCAYDEVTDFFRAHEPISQRYSIAWFVINLTHNKPQRYFKVVTLNGNSLIYCHDG